MRGPFLNAWFRRNFCHPMLSSDPPSKYLFLCYFLVRRWFCGCGLPKNILNKTVMQDDVVASDLHIALFLRFSVSLFVVRVCVSTKLCSIWRETCKKMSPTPPRTPFSPVKRHLSGTLIEGVSQDHHVIFSLQFCFSSFLYWSTLFS